MYEVPKTADCISIKKASVLHCLNSASNTVKKKKDFAKSRSPYNGTLGKI